MAKVALTHLFTKPHFDICIVRDLCKITGRSQTSPAFNLLHPLHCMSYADMPGELLDKLPLLVNECLRPAPHCVATDVALDGVVFGHG